MLSCFISPTQNPGSEPNRGMREERMKHNEPNETIRNLFRGVPYLSTLSLYHGKGVKISGVFPGF
jgi:hypothetical protein